MKEKVCCIYDLDERYAMRLAETFNKQDIFPYKTLAFTMADALKDCTLRNDIEILLVSEEVDGDFLSLIKANNIFILGEMESDLSNNYICKFQSVDGMMKQVLATKHKGEIINSSLKITSVYSPGNDYRRTILGVLYACNESDSHKVLYINLDVFSCVESIFGMGDKNLSDLLFYYLEDSENKIAQMVNCINSFRRLDYILPFNSPEDVACMNNDTILGVIKCIEETGIYNEIVIDLGNLMGNPWEFMSGCDKVILPNPENEIESEKLSQFNKFVERSRFSKIAQIKKIINLSIPEGIITADKLNNLSRVFEEV